MLGGAVGATEEDAVNFHAVTNDLTSTVGTFGCKRVDGAFETIKYMRFTIHSHLKTFIVVVSAYFTRADVAIASK